MRASGVSPDVTPYNVAIAACQRVGRWETAGALQAGRDAVGGRPEWPENLLAFNAALRRHDVRSRQVSSMVSSKVSSPPVVRTSPPVMLIASDRPSVAALVPVIGGWGPWPPPRHLRRRTQQCRRWVLSGSAADRTERMMRAGTPVRSKLRFEGCEVVTFLSGISRHSAAWKREAASLRQTRWSTRSVAATRPRPWASLTG